MSQTAYHNVFGCCTAKWDRPSDSSSLPQWFYSGKITYFNTTNNAECNLYAYPKPRDDETCCINLQPFVIRNEAMTADWTSDENIVRDVHRVTNSTKKQPCHKYWLNNGKSAQSSYAFVTWLCAQSSESSRTTKNHQYSGWNIVYWTKYPNRCVSPINNYA